MGEHGGRTSPSRNGLGEGALDHGQADDGTLAHETRSTMVGETLQLANFSAVTQAAVAVALTHIFWNVAPRWYLSALCGTVCALCAATLAASLSFRGTFRDGASPRAVSRGVTFAKLLAAGLGTAWGTLPAVLLPQLDASSRTVVVAVCAGLISDAYVVGPIFSVAMLMATPVAAGLYLGLAGCEAPFGGNIALLLTLYGAFVCLSARRMCRLSHRHIWDRLTVRDQRETIKLLLDDFSEGARDSLWETDAGGRLRKAHPRLAEAFGIDERSLRPRTVTSLVRQFAAGGGEDEDAVLDAIASRKPFRDRTLRLRAATGDRWLTLNGKPSFDRNGLFRGYRGVVSDVTAARVAQERVAFLAGHDTLTGLPNRAAFQEDLCALCAEGGRGALLYLDLDGFKAVNDGMGHVVGDGLLREVAKRLGALAGTARPFRLGGDEFAVIAAGPGREGAEAVASAIVEGIAEPFEVDGTRVSVGASVGVAHVPGDATDPGVLLSRADLALYDAKAAGKGCWRAFDPSLEERVTRRRELDAEMRMALATDSMELHYQPLVEMETGRVVGFEALLRWDRPGHGWVSPAEMIPIAESTGFIVDIGRWALRRACTDALAWPGLRVAVNISSMHVRIPGFHREVGDILAETGLPPASLEIEVTESVLLDHGPDVLENLRRLRESGVRVALDDFGTGYSSLSYLTEFRFDKVKVDRSFVRDLQGRPEKAAVVEAIARMARALSMDVTVEGVETLQQLAVLRDKRCHVAQGFLYSPARPAAEASSLIERIEAMGPRPSAEMAA